MEARALINRAFSGRVECLGFSNEKSWGFGLPRVLEFEMKELGRSCRGPLLFKRRPCRVSKASDITEIYSGQKRGIGFSGHRRSRLSMDKKGTLGPHPPRTQNPLV